MKKHFDPIAFLSPYREKDKVREYYYAQQKLLVVCSLGEGKHAR